MARKSVSFEVEGLMLRGQLYLPDGQAPYPTVCVCHGIPSKKPDPTDRGYPLLAEKICRQGFAVLIFNFRGAGLSDGNLDIMGWTRDLNAAIDYLLTLSDVDTSRLFLLGYSGGAAVSIYVASQDSRVSGVAVCACPAEFTFLTDADNARSVIDHFRDIGAIRDEGFPPSITEWFDGFDKVKPLDYIAGISPRPLLLVHGNRDETVDVSHAYRLYNSAGQPKQIFIVDGARHRLRQSDEAVIIVTDWLKARLL